MVMLTVDLGLKENYVLEDCKLKHRLVSKQDALKYIVEYYFVHLPESRKRQILKDLKENYVRNHNEKA